MEGFPYSGSHSFYLKPFTFLVDGIPFSGSLPFSWMIEAVPFSGSHSEKDLVLLEPFFVNAFLLINLFFIHKNIILLDSYS